MTKKNEDTKTETPLSKSAVEGFVMSLRLVLTVIMIYGIYLETGPCTAVFAAAVAMAIELQSKITSNIAKILKAHGA